QNPNDKFASRSSFPTLSLPHSRLKHQQAKTALSLRSITSCGRCAKAFPRSTEAS
ncbi:unnamed protein product, partial [Pylaiella littoralis]